MIISPFGLGFLLTGDQQLALRDPSLARFAGFKISHDADPSAEALGYIQTSATRAKKASL
ncbi:MAG TPA: hypothetical protein VJV03_10205 [Pyrinomonadaceae bacterium]|nr:hypothetical protein [Pyrinomonadaceae bacterium]